MSILIEQTPQEFKEAISFNNNCEIISIRLDRASVRSLRSADWDSDEQFETNVSFTPGAVSTAEDRIDIGVNFTYQLSRPEANDPDRIVVGIECSFDAAYVLRPDYKPTQSEIIAFQKGNGVFNCWAFFREFVQTTAARMEYPPPPIPFLKIKLKPQEKNSE